MKLARGPQTEFFSNYCSGIPGLASYEMPNEVCEGNFLKVFWGLRYLGRRPAILDLRVLAAGLRYLGLGT